MMQFFRKYGAPVFAVAAFTVLAWMVFSLSGLTDKTGVTRNDSVGTVNGMSIDARSYQTVVQQTIDARQREGGTLSAEDVQQIRNEVWEQFIQNRILDAEYKRLAIGVSTDEVAEAMKQSPPPEFRKIPDFQTDSQFDLAKYQRWLQSPVAQQYLPSLEAQYRDQIMRSKLLRVVTADVYLSDPALWEEYRDANEKAKVHLAAIIPRNAVPDSVVKLTSEEVEKYYADHKNEFKRPRTAFLSYLYLPRLTDKSDTTAAFARAQSVRAELVGGAPFGEVAKRESADTATAPHGGELGEWSRGSMAPAFDSAAFSLPLSTISQPVLTVFGYHLIQVTARKGNKAKGRHILIPVEISGEHRDRLDGEADSLERLGAERLDPAALDTTARALGLAIGHAIPTQEGSRVQVGNQVVPDGGVWAFEARVGETSRVVETSYAYWLFRLDSLQVGGVPPLAKIRPTVEIGARDAKKWIAARDMAKDLLKRVSEGTPLADAAKALRLPNQVLGPFTRSSPPFPNPILVGAVFALDSGKVSGAIETKDGIYVVQVLQRIKADSAGFVKDLDKIRVDGIRSARQERIRSYISALRDAAKIDDKRAQLFKTAAQVEQAAEAQKRKG
jgi:peptidyl-prolyl cis-trans isomerase D